MGIVEDSIEGSGFDTGTVVTNSDTTFTSEGIDDGTYSYVKTGTNTGQLNYVSRDNGLEFDETENGTINLTFTSESGGTYTSSGSYSGTYFGENYTGTFTGSGSFTYTKSSQTITFANPGSKSFGDVPFILSATARAFFF